MSVSATIPRFRSALIASSTLLAACCGLMPLTSMAAASPDQEVSIFAFGAGSTRSFDFPKWVPKMTAIGLTDLRCYGVGWGCEPEQGKFNFKITDDRFDYLMTQNVQPGILLMGHRPKWLTKDASGKPYDKPPAGLPVDCLPEYGNYVSKLAEHTKGKVKYFESWNEPPNGTRNSPPTDYAKMMVTVYDALKAANPKAQLGMAAKSAYLYYLDAAIKAGAEGHYDYITLHPYEILGTVMTHPGTEPIYLSIASKVRKMLAAQDPAKVNVPIWFTELGYDASRGADKQGHALVKAYTMGIAQGIACINWFEGMDGDSGPMGMIDGKGNPRPSYTAMAQLIQRLGKHPGYLGWLLLNDKHYAFVFQGPKSTVLATWTATTAPDNVDFGQPVQIVDPLTGTAIQAAKYQLTLAPILVDGVPDKLVALAKSNKNNPFPWGGDYTNAKSVSVTMGEKNIEKGLHTQSAETIAADVVAYGGNARAGTVPGGTVFMVDPNFLSYNTVPIEIRAVVRRNEKNDPATIVLEYESTSGYRKATPYVVPDNKEWHTAIWKIDDAQFVSSWAFDFRFNNGPYCLQSVTVTKLPE